MHVGAGGSRIARKLLPGTGSTVQIFVATVHLALCAELLISMSYASGMMWIAA
jgi:hypothetical protein